MEGEGPSLGDRDSPLVCELNGRLKGIHEDYRKWRTIDVSCAKMTTCCVLFWFCAEKERIPPFGVSSIFLDNSRASIFFVNKVVGHKS